MTGPIEHVGAADAKQLWTYAQSHEAEMVEELRQLVAIESGSGDRQGIEAVGELFSGWLGALGFATEAVLTPTCQHLLARRPHAGGRRLLVVIHLDTVWPRGTLVDFGFRLDGERVYGPGVADMKGGLAILLWALRGLAKLNLNPDRELAIFMTADEELGSPSARAHIERLARESDAVLVMEPGRESGALVTSRGAVGALELETHGQSAHSVTGRVGASAVHALARKIIDLEALSDRSAGLVVNVGKIQGGSARQVVPERAWASIDLRAPTTERAGGTLERIRAIVARNDVAGSNAELRGGITRPAFEANAGTQQLFEVARSCGHGLGLDLLEESTGAGSDGNFAAALGVPTLDGLGAHGFNVCSKDEYILRSSLPQRAALLGALIANLPVIGTDAA